MLEHADILCVTVIHNGSICRLVCLSWQISAASSFRAGLAKLWHLTKDRNNRKKIQGLVALRVLHNAHPYQGPKISDPSVNRAPFQLKMAMWVSLGFFRTGEGQTKPGRILKEGHSGHGAVDNALSLHLQGLYQTSQTAIQTRLANSQGSSACWDSVLLA